MTELTETSPELRDALARELRALFGTDVACGAWNSGGGCYILSADLSQDGRGIGPQLWLTRDSEWLLGFYDFGGDPNRDDDGVVVSLTVHDPENPDSIAAAVAGILRRLGVRTLR